MVMEVQRERLRRYVEAEAAILRGQSYVLNGRSVTRADLETVRKVIDGLIASGVTLDGDGRKRRTTRVVYEE